MIGRLFLGFAVSLALIAPAVAELAITGAPVTMRTEPTGKARVVQQIPRSAEIDVMKCARGWCRASWRGRFGYVPAVAVVLGPAGAGGAMPPPFVNAAAGRHHAPDLAMAGVLSGRQSGFRLGGW